MVLTANCLPDSSHPKPKAVLSGGSWRAVRGGREREIPQSSRTAPMPSSCASSRDCGPCHPKSGPDQSSCWLRDALQ